MDSNMIDNPKSVCTEKETEEINEAELMKYISDTNNFKSLNVNTFIDVDFVYPRHYINLYSQRHTPYIFTKSNNEQTRKFNTVVTEGYNDGEDEMVLHQGMPRRAGAHVKKLIKSSENNISKKFDSKVLYNVGSKNSPNFKQKEVIKKNRNDTSKPILYGLKLDLPNITLKTSAYNGGGMNDETYSSEKTQFKEISVDHEGDKIKLPNDKNKKHKFWTPSLNSKTTKLDSNNLLGNMCVARWDDDLKKKKKKINKREKIKVTPLRNFALNQVISKELDHKKRMDLDSWNAGLDKGKIRKVKPKSSVIYKNQVPVFNQFHFIQNNLQNMKSANGSLVQGNHNN